jgi:predicted AAA+ superfamily ATPase
MTLWFNVHEDELDWNENIGTHKIGIEACQRYIILDRRKVLKIWEKHISELYDRPNRPEILEDWTEEEIGRQNL